VGAPTPIGGAEETVIGEAVSLPSTIGGGWPAHEYTSVRSRGS
jgi:hypothetical protein